MLTALVVDDEPLARTRLRRLLESLGSTIVGEAEDAADGLRLSEEVKPDVMFLDIKMPDLNGLQAASAMARIETSPVVVFVTGYSEFAVDAFEQNALDYLLKPVTLERLAVTLARVRERVASKRSYQHESTHVPEGAASFGTLRSLPVRGDYTVRFVPLEQVICIVSRKRQVYVITREAEFHTYYSLSQLEKMLPQDRYLRVHDSAVVNIDAIVELLFLGDHAYEIRLSNNQLLRVGRSHYSVLRQRMGLLSPPSV